MEKITEINDKSYIVHKVNTEKGLYIKTYGCQMNIYDSERMVDLLRPHGFTLVDDQEGADLIILNTCHIREKAAEKIYSELGRVAKIKEMNQTQLGRKTIVVVSGCVAQAEGEEVVKRAPCVDIVVGPQSYHNLPIFLEEIKRTNKWIVNLDFKENEKFDQIANNEVLYNKKVSVYLSIQEGCDKFCHFCVVPYTRGAEFSRDVSAVYREASRIVAQGAKEITLLGQNVSAYHGLGPENRQYSLGELIRVLSNIRGLESIRYTTSHPRDMIENTLFEEHGNNPKLQPFVHLPVQSGSNNILQSMNRKHTVEEYLQIIEKFRKYQPNIAFSSDFIVGYPGETEKDFDDSLALIEEVQYAHAYSFKYSPRPGTPAAAIAKQIPEEVKNERLQTLQKLLREQQAKFNEQFIQKEIKVLFQSKGKKEGQIVGKSPHMQSVIVDVANVKKADEYLGTYQNVKIFEATTNSLFGKIQNASEDLF